MVIRMLRCKLLRDEVAYSLVGPCDQDKGCFGIDRSHFVKVNVLR